MAFVKVVARSACEEEEEANLREREVREIREIREKR
jgi:hypothetical protein